MRVMKWIEDEVAAAFKRGAENFSGLHLRICCCTATTKPG